MAASASGVRSIASESALTKAGSILGTPAFMAPEQIEGEPEPRSDIYSVGTVAYFALTGQVPFVRTSVAELLSAQRQDQPPSLPSIPADLEAVVLRCLAKLPAERYASATVLEQALAACACSATWDAAAATAFWQGREGPVPAGPKEQVLPTPAWESPVEVKRAKA